MWNFTMHFIILILILQTALLVYTNNINNLKDTNQKLMNNAVFDGVTEQMMTLSTSEIETTSEMNKGNFISSDKQESGRANNHSNISRKFSTEKYSEIDSIEMTDTYENKLESIATKEQFYTKEKESIIARNLFSISKSFENITSSQLPINHKDDPIKLLSKNIPVNSVSQSNNANFARYSNYLMKSVMQSLIRSSWILVYKPLFDMVVSKKVSNSIDEMKNVMNSRFDSLKIRRDNITNIMNLNTSISNNSHLPSIPSLNLKHLNNNKATKNTTIIAQPNTMIFSTTESTMLFQKMMIDDYSNLRVQKPFSSRYLKISNETHNETIRRKRAIRFNNDYNSADRQELASYFYNDKQIRENYLNYAQPADHHNFSQTIYNSDKINSRVGHDTYSIPKIFLRNQDDSMKESSMTSQKSNSDISQNVPTDINDSSLLYLIEKFGYSIFDEIDSQLSTTEMNNEHKTNYSNYNLPPSRSAVRKQKRIGTRKRSSLRKNITYRQRSESTKKGKRSRTRNLTKHRKNRRNMSMKSAMTKDAMGHNTKSSRYLRIHSKLKKRNNKQNLSKRKRKVSIKRSNRKRNSSRWRNSQQNRQRFRQLRQLRKAGYYSV